jgi:CRP-like cAMP-binding protein
MPPGSIIGETSLLTGAPALGTVRARSKVFLLAMPRAVFQEVIMTHPQVLEHLGTLAENRRRQSQLWKQV